MSIKLWVNSSYWDYSPLLRYSLTTDNLHPDCDQQIWHKCDKNHLPNSEITVHIETTHLFSDVPAQFMICRDIKIYTKILIMKSATNVIKLSTKPWADSSYWDLTHTHLCSDDPAQFIICRDIKTYTKFVIIKSAKNVIKIVYQILT